jgi:hypothetical protein
MPGILAFIALLKWSRVSPLWLALTVEPLSNQSIRKVCYDRRTSALPYQHWVWHDSFSDEETTNASTADSYIYSPDRSADTRTCHLRQYNPNILISLSFIPQQVPMRIVFWLSFKLFGTHTAETFWYSRTWWRCDAHGPGWYQVVQWHAEALHNDHTAPYDPLWHMCVGLGGQPGCARRSVLLLPSLNLLRQLNTAVCCKQSSL